MSHRRPFDVPDFRKGDQLTAAELNAIADAVRVALRASGPGMIATAGGIAMRAFRQSSAAVVLPPWVRIVSSQLVASGGSTPPVWWYAWQQRIAESDGLGGFNIVDGPQNSTVGGNPYALHARNSLEVWSGSGSSLRYGVGVLLTQPSGATLVPQPIANGVELPLEVLFAGVGGGYRFAMPNGYDVVCPAALTAPPNVERDAGDEALSLVLKGVLGW
jgi:hypothetical protein